MTGPAYVRFTLDVEVADYQVAVAVLAGLPTPGWQEQAADDGRTLTFWVPSPSLEDDSVAAALCALRDLGPCSATPEPDDWERRWLDFHHPVQVGRVRVRPPWAASADGSLDVLIDVGMAFGTGSHVTTRQCLDLLQAVAPGRLLDVGCGSGVLAIAGVRLGFPSAAAIDVDEAAVSAAAANALLNGVHLDLLLGDATSSTMPLPAADVVVANVALRPVVALGARLGAPAAEATSSAPAAPPRDAILAGLLAAQVPEAVAAWPAYAEVERRSDGEWVAVRLRRRSSFTSHEVCTADAGADGVHGQGRRPPASGPPD